MAIKKTIELDAKFDTESIDQFNKSVQETGTSVEDLVGGVDDLNTELSETGDAANKSLKGIEKGGKDAEKSVRGIGTGFKIVGNAIKAAGIGLVLAAFATLKELLESNQKVMNFFTTAFNAVSLVFNDFVSLVTDNFDGMVQSFKDFFSIQGLKDFGTAIKDNVIERIASLIEAWGFLGEAMLKVFKGDFAGALDSVKEAGKEMVDVLTGVDGSLDKATEFVIDLVEATGEYAENVWDSAEAMTALSNAAKIAAAEQQGLVEKYDREAELLRQTRDNVNKSIAERIEANDKLNEVLDNQFEAMTRNAKLQLLAAEQEFKRVPNLENEIALIEAKNEVLAVAAQIEGFRSEQDTNRIALLNEERDLTDTQIAAENQRAINRSQFNAEQIENEILRIDALRESLELEKELETERLENQIEILAEGTQARIDAEQELLDFKEDIHQREIELAKEKTEVEKESAKTTEEIDKAVGDAKIGIAQDTIGLVTDLLGENTKAGKAAGVAQATMNTYEGITAVWKAPPVGNTIIDTIAKIASTAVVAASGFSAVRNIQATSLEGTGGSPSYSSPGAPPSIQAPSFNVIGDTNTNQITDAINSQNQAPVKAYVVASDVSSQQELDRNTVSIATL